MSKFTKVCEKYGHTEKTMINFIESYNCSDGVSLCEHFSRVHKYEMSLKDAQYLIDTADNVTVT
jgi:hypothetical protein